jgi:hypothetical protein
MSSPAATTPNRGGKPATSPKSKSTTRICYFGKECKRIHCVYRHDVPFPYPHPYVRKGGTASSSNTAAPQPVTAPPTVETKTETPAVATASESKPEQPVSAATSTTPLKSKPVPSQPPRQSSVASPKKSTASAPPVSAKKSTNPSSSNAHNKTKEHYAIPCCLAYLAGNCPYSAGAASASGKNDPKCCPKRHPTDVHEIQLLVQQLQQVPCRYFGHCRTKNCLYAHPQKEDIAADTKDAPTTVDKTPKNDVKPSPSTKPEAVAKEPPAPATLSVTKADARKASTKSVANGSKTTDYHKPEPANRTSSAAFDTKDFPPLPGEKKVVTPEPATMVSFANKVAAAATESAPPLVEVAAVEKREPQIVTSNKKVTAAESVAVIAPVVAIAPVPTTVRAPSPATVQPPPVSAWNKGRPNLSATGGSTSLAPPTPVVPDKGPTLLKASSLPLPAAKSAMTESTTAPLSTVTAAAVSTALLTLDPVPVADSPLSQNHNKNNTTQNGSSKSRKKKGQSANSATSSTHSNSSRNTMEEKKMDDDARRDSQPATAAAPSAAAKSKVEAAARAPPVAETPLAATLETPGTAPSGEAAAAALPAAAPHNYGAYPTEAALNDPHYQQQMYYYQQQYSMYMQQQQQYPHHPYQYHPQQMASPPPPQHSGVVEPAAEAAQQQQQQPARPGVAYPTPAGTAGYYGSATSPMYFVPSTPQEAAEYQHYLSSGGSAYGAPYQNTGAYGSSQTAPASYPNDSAYYRRNSDLAKTTPSGVTGVKGGKSGLVYEEHTAAMTENPQSGGSSSHGISSSLSAPTMSMLMMTPPTSMNVAAPAFVPHMSKR